MSTLSCFFGISLNCLAAATLGLITGPALAQSTANAHFKSGQREQNLAIFAEQHVIRINFPVAWQLTRMRTNSANPSMVTETYREVWTLEQTPINNQHYLQSPRARVQVYVDSKDGQAARLPAVWPKQLMLQPSAFGQLLGLSELDQTESKANFDDDRFVAIALTGRGRAISEVSLRLADEQSFEIQVAISDL